MMGGKISLVIKTYQIQKTIYDPAIISNRQMLDWGLEAMQNGVIQSRIIE